MCTEQVVCTGVSLHSPDFFWLPRRLVSMAPQVSCKRQTVDLIGCLMSAREVHADHQLSMGWGLLARPGYSCWGRGGDARRSAGERRPAAGRRGGSNPVAERSISRWPKAQLAHASRAGPGGERQGRGGECQFCKGCMCGSTVCRFTKHEALFIKSPEFEHFLSSKSLLTMVSV